MSLGGGVQRKPLSDFQAWPSSVQCFVQLGSRCRFGLGREVVASQEEQAIIFEDKRPEGD